MNCAACGKAIEEGGYATLADGSSYHKTCFTCKHCLLPLSNKFAGGPDGFYHPEVISYVLVQPKLKVF